ncbi:hypothetical protein ACOI1H_14095 [Loktanella sp. DJP18]
MAYDLLCGFALILRAGQVEGKGRRCGTTATVHVRNRVSVGD